MILTTMLASHLLLIGVTLEGVHNAGQPPVVFCGVDTFNRGGGVITNGWDGPGLNSTTVFWYTASRTDDISLNQQRLAYINALELWASIAQIHFVEIAAPNRPRSIDFQFAIGEHCVLEPGECGDSDCAFDGPGGTFAHAAFPPGGQGTCGSASTESRSGNVHFDDAEEWERGDLSPTSISLELLAAHEIGHALGLLHQNDPMDGPHIMRPSFSVFDGLHSPSDSDIAQIRVLYAAGAGSVTTLEDSGIWVNSSWLGFESGIASEPFATVSRASIALPTEQFNASSPITIHIQAGLYPESVTISEPCVIKAESGTAFIGR